MGAFVFFFLFFFLMFLFFFFLFVVNFVIHWNKTYRPGLLITAHLWLVWEYLFSFILKDSFAAMGYFVDTIDIYISVIIYF